MFRLNLVILMPILQCCLHNDRIGITLRPYWSVYYVVGKPVMYTLPLVICLTYMVFVMLVLILIAFIDSLDSSSESCFSCTFSIYGSYFLFKHEKINKRKNNSSIFDFLISFLIADTTDQCTPRMQLHGFIYY